MDRCLTPTRCLRPRSECGAGSDPAGKCCAVRGSPALPSLKTSMQKIHGVAGIVDEVDAVRRIKYEAKERAIARWRPARAIEQRLRHLHAFGADFRDEAVGAVHRQ